MKTTRAILLAVIALVVLSASAQDRFEIFGGYSYLQFSPTIAGTPARGFNGGGAGATLYFLKILGIKADFMAYGNTTFTATYSGPVVTPHSGTYTAQGDMFTYLFGPEIRIPIPKVRPFGEALFGGSQTNAYVNLSNAINQAGLNVGSQHPFTLALGGGLDVDAGKRLAIRLGEFDYVLTRYHNPLTNNSSQNNFRYCGGLILKF
jgi:Outer membrane protein beta-barrel domain